MAKKELQVNQETTISIPKVEYIPTDKRMWHSIKRRIQITDKIFDFKDILLVYIWCVWWWWISYIFVEEKIKHEVVRYLIILTVIAVLVFIVYFILKKHKREFNNTIIDDMNEIERC